MKAFLFAVALWLILVAVLVLFVASPWWLLTTYVAMLASWMALARAGRQTWSVAQVGIATLPQRVGSSAVVVVDIAAVVGVLVAILSMGAGFERTLKQTGSDDTAIILSAGARSETGSTLSRDTAAVASDAPQVLKNAQNQPIASPEQLVSVLVPKKSTRLDAGVAIRGVGEHVWDLWPHAKIVAGRKFKSALRELIAGKGVHEKFLSSDVGSTVTFDGQSWTVYGLREL